MTRPDEIGGIAADGWPVLAVAGLITIILTFIALPLGTLALGLLLWLRHIMRVPSRQVPDQAATLVLSPADGVISEISHASADEAADSAGMTRITIRTGLADAQLQRSPVAGRIRDNFLVPGLFLNDADAVSARRDNERREITIDVEVDTESGDAGLSRAGEDQIMVVQIGGRTARQLVCRHGPGKFLAAGAPLGMARIGGMTDLLVPSAWNVVAAVGQTVLAGETILAKRVRQSGAAGSVGV